MIEFVFVIMIMSFFGALIAAAMAGAWALFEDTKLGQMLVERIRSRFEDDDE
jgi:hypothetical protein